jgi:hypothetical protein
MNMHTHPILIGETESTDLKIDEIIDVSPSTKTLPPIKKIFIFMKHQSVKHRV